MAFVESTVRVEFPGSVIAHLLCRRCTVKKDGCLLSRECGEKGECRALAGNLFLGEVIHTLQEVFWIASICWILIQAWDKFHNRKK